MIQVTRFNGAKYFINPEMIQSVEATPDTVITLTSNQKILVKESVHTVVEEFIHYQRLVHNPDLKVEIGEE
ncbi:MAG: flagellar FlbD family protein [Chloroflexota bacterium]